jgi:hypothetical protein
MTYIFDLTCTKTAWTKVHVPRLTTGSRGVYINIFMKDVCVPTNVSGRQPSETFKHCEDCKSFCANMKHDKFQLLVNGRQPAKTFTNLEDCESFCATMN